MALRFIDELEEDSLKGKRVLARFDFNVPLDENSKILDTSRIDRALPTIRKILESDCSRLIMMSHLGRPNGKVVDGLSLEPVATYLAEKLGEDVILTESAVDSGVKSYLSLPKVKIILLENLRFHKEETQDDKEFAAKIAEYADVYINDAFGVSHREHASVHAITAYFKGSSLVGYLMKDEIAALNKVAHNPKKPFIAIVGGAKVSDKIKTIEKLVISADKILIGGAMAYPFLKAQGIEVGKSLCSDEDIELAKVILKADRGSKIILPEDHLISKEFNGPPIECFEKAIPKDMMGLDIGKSTLHHFQEVLSTAKTILWNGPMGIFENSNYAQGTMGLAQIISELDAYSLVGGGDSVSAVKKSGLSDKFDHISTGGGASLEFIEKGDLPGIRALKFGIN
jgi:phosphoglycerate kinase